MYNMPNRQLACIDKIFFLGFFPCIRHQPEYTTSNEASQRSFPCCYCVPERTVKEPLSPSASESTAAADLPFAFGKKMA